MTTKAKQVGKVNMPEGTNEIVVNFSQQFSILPSIKITGNKGINIYLTDVTVSSFKINKVQDDSLLVHYIAIEGDADDLPLNEETIVVTVQPDPLDSSILRFYFNGTYPYTLNTQLGRLYKFDVSGLQSTDEFAFGYGQGDGNWDPQYMIMGSSVVEQTAAGLENSLVDYKILDSNLVQLRLEEPAQNGVTIERSISMTSETVNYFHVWNTNEANYGGYTRIIFPS